MTLTDAGSPDPAAQVHKLSHGVVLFMRLQCCAQVQKPPSGAVSTQWAPRLALDLTVSKSVTFNLIPVFPVAFFFSF